MIFAKAFSGLRQPRNSLSGYVVNAPHEWGQPYSLASTDDGNGALISPDRMRDIVGKIATPAAATNAIVDYASGVELTVTHVDKSQKVDPDEAAYVMSFIKNPNKDNTGVHVNTALIRDIVSIGYGGLEIIDDATGRPAALRNIDGVRFYVDYDEHGTLLGYNQLNAHGMPIRGPDGVHAWNPDEVLYFKRNPQTKTPYPFSHVQQLFVCAVIEDLMLSFIGGKFTESNMPYGILDLGDITPDELKKAVASWNSQVKSQHKIMLTNTRNGGKWIPFGYNLKDLEATALLDKLRSMIMGILGVTMNELGESQDVSKANGFYLSYTFKNRAILPIIREVCGVYTKFVQERLGLSHLEISAKEIDSRDELLQTQIDDTQLKHGTKTINQLRNRSGDISVQGGDEPFLFANGSWIPVSMALEMAQAQLRAVTAEADLLEVQVQQSKLQIAMMLAGGMQQGADGDKIESPISPPMIRAPKTLETFTTPDAPGSSSFKNKFPRPQPLKGDATGPPQKPRGGKQTLHNMGLRSDESSP